MIRIRLAKHKAITKVGKDISKEMQALVNKVTRRSNDRRTLRTRLDDVIATYVVKVLDQKRTEALGGSFHYCGSTPSTLVGLKNELSKVITPFYEGDHLNDDPKLYAEELEALVQTLSVSVDVVSASDSGEVDQLKADTKTVCGFVDGHWDSNNTLVLLAKSDLVELVPNEGHCARGGELVTETTCGDHVKLVDAWATYRDSKDAKAPEKHLPHECFWYCKEDAKFFTKADISAKENAKKQIRAYIQNHGEGLGRGRW